VKAPRADTAPSAREKYPRGALAAAPDATLIVDRRGKIVFASNLVEGLFGYPPSELLGLTIETLVPGRFRELHVHDRARFQSTPIPRPMGAGLSLYGLHKDGHDIPVEVSLSPLGKGDDAHVICAVRDVTQRRILEDQMHLNVLRNEALAAESAAVTRQSKDSLRLFVEHAPAAVAMLDDQMRYMIVSNRWLDDYGLGDRDIIGLSHYDVFPEIPAHWKEAHRRCLAGQVLQSAEDSFVRSDGQTEWLHWELVPWRGLNGMIGGIMLFSEVVTKRKLAELALIKSREELEERVLDRTRALETAKNEASLANALKSRFLAAASHDLRQPLHAAGLYLSVLARQLEHADQRAICDKARQPLESMTGILDVLLDLASLESGAIKPHLRDFSVGDLLDRVVVANQLQAEEKGLGLVCQTSECVAHSDPALLERVIDNLVFNAIRYTENGEIAVKCERGENTVRISVTDTGIGIPDEALETIFDEFVQLDNSERDKRKGLGLGLSIAKYIINLLGHRIEAKSIVGRGSTFTIELPIGKSMLVKSDTRAPSAAADMSGDRRPVVLFVDDDPMVAEAMLMMLRVLDLDAHGADDGDKALAIIKSGLRPDVIVSDFRLPNYDGAEVIRRVREALGAAVPAILLTGDKAMQRTDPAKLSDCTILYKPVDPDGLGSLIKKLAR